MAPEIVDAESRAARLDCIPPKNKKEEKINRLFTTILSESRLNPAHYLPSEWRRDIWGWLATRLLPGAYPDGSLTKPPGLLRAEELVKEGYGLIIASRHFSERDFLMLTAFFRNQSDISKGGRETYAPIAFHQFIAGAKRLLEFHNVIPWPVVTTETIRKKRNFDVRGNKLRPGEGSILFQSAAVGLLDRAGILFFAPSGTRTLKHEPPRLIKPIEQLINETGDKVAVLILGLDIQDPEVTDYENYQSYNPGLIYTINMGETLTKQELLEEARKQGIGVDKLVADKMAWLVRPSTLGDAYSEIREERLTQEPQLRSKPRYNRLGRFISRFKGR